MTFIMKDNIVCAGKYVANVESNGDISINLLSSSDNVQTPLCDASGNNVTFNGKAFDLLEDAIRKHWTYVDLRGYQNTGRN